MCFAAMEACRAHLFNSMGKVVVHKVKEYRFPEQSRAKSRGFLAVFLFVFAAHAFAAEPVNADPSAYLASLPGKASLFGAQEPPTQTSGDHGTSGHHDADASDGHAPSSGEAAHTESNDSGGHAHAGGEETGSEAGKGSEAGSNDHDHATDHGSTSGGTGGRILTLLGKLHVLAVHLPIALLPLAGLLELAGMWLNSAKLRFAAALNFILGGLSAWIAVALGWIAEGQSNYSGELWQVLFWHRWMGVGVAVLVGLGLLGLFLRRRDSPAGRILYRTALFCLLVLVPLTAHFGGSLIYGPDYLFDMPVPGIPSAINP